MGKILLSPCIFIYNFIKYIFLGLRSIPVIIFMGIKGLFAPLTKSSKKRKNEMLAKQKNENLYAETSTAKDKKRVENAFSNETRKVKKYKPKKNEVLTPLTVNFDEDAEKNPEKIVYEYIVQNKDGEMIKGYFSAFSKVEVHSFLLSEGYTVYDIRTSKWIRFLHGRENMARGKFKTKDLIFLLAQLSTYLKAGITLVDSIKILIKQFKNRSYKNILSGVAYDLSIGKKLSEAMEKQGEAFPRLLINMIKAAEMTGELPETLDDMEEYYTEAEETRKAMISAMMYPTIIFIVAIGVGVFIMLYVVPKFVDIYNSMDGADIPGITLFILALSDFLSDYVLLIGVVIIIAILIFSYLYKTVKSFRKAVQHFGMKLPGFGNIIIYNEVTMFTKTFASLLAHNVFITDSMDILNKVTNNEIYKAMIQDAVTNIAKGGKVSEAFKDQWAFPIPAYEMIVTGEETGQLPEMMVKVSAYYQDLHKNAVARLKTLIEPIMIMFLTVMVGVIVLSIVVPMFNMYSAIQQ